MRRTQTDLVREGVAVAVGGRQGHGEGIHPGLGEHHLDGRLLGRRSNQLVRDRGHGEEVHPGLGEHHLDGRLLRRRSH